VVSPLYVGFSLTVGGEMSFTNGALPLSCVVAFFSGDVLLIKLMICLSHQTLLQLSDMLLLCLYNQNM